MQARAILGAGVLAVALVATPALSSAAPVTRVLNTLQSVSCVFETVEGDYVFLTADSSSGGSGSAMFVETPDFELVLQGDGGAATVDDGTFSAEVALTDAATGNLVGQAVIEATRAPSGEPVTEQLRERSGNSWTTGTVTTTNYLVDIESVSVPRYTVLAENDDCVSESITFDVKSTNPNARIFADSGFESAVCEIDGIANGLVLLSGDLPQVRFDVVIDDGVAVQEAGGDLVLRGGSSGQATAPLLEGEQEVGALSITVQLDRVGRRTQESTTFEGVTERQVVVPYRATIRVSTSDGRSGTVHCYAEYRTTKIIISPKAS